MKRAHTITISLFATPEEDKEALKEKLLSIIPLDLEEERLGIKETTAAGFNDRTITILELVLEKERHTNAFLDFLAARLSGAQKQQLREQENRLDQDCRFYLRFRKQDLPALVLTDKGDCVHVKVCVAAFPKRRAVAKGIIEELLN